MKSYDNSLAFSVGMWHLELRYLGVQGASLHQMFALLCFYCMIPLLAWRYMGWLFRSVLFLPRQKLINEFIDLEAFSLEAIENCGIAEFLNLLYFIKTTL